MPAKRSSEPARPLRPHRGGSTATHPHPLPCREGRWYDPPVKRIPSRNTARARRLRREATPQERALWNILSPYRPRFTRQLSIDPYTIDLACREAHLLIELDGSQHAGSEHDEHRTRFLISDGWHVIRFWNSDVNENADGVAEAILLKVEELTGKRPEAKPPRKRSPRPDE